MSKKRKKNSGNPAKRPPVRQRVEPMEPEDVETVDDMHQAMQYYAQRAVEVFGDKITTFVPDEHRAEVDELLVKLEDAVRAREAVEVLSVSDEEYRAGQRQGWSPHQIFFAHLMGPAREGVEMVSGIIAPVLDQINEEDARQ